MRGAAAELIAAAGAAGRPVLAVDTPSGLDATDGSVHGAALPARVTVTFGVPKQGFLRGEGPKVAGEVLVADISLPAKITAARVIVE